jgi:hypothetical protein
MVAAAEAISVPCACRSCSFSILLAHPAHDRAEGHEHGEAQAHHPQRALGAVHHDLVICHGAPCASFLDAASMTA